MGLSAKGLEGSIISFCPCKNMFLFMLVLVVMTSSLLPASKVDASEVVLDEIKVLPNGEKTTFNIGFGLPLECQKHFPRDWIPRSESVEDACRWASVNWFP